MTVLALAALGGLLGHIVAGSPTRWAATMGIGGIAVTFAGIQLHIA